MIDVTPNRTSEFPGASIPESERNRAMQLGISFNGNQFIYRDFRYDQLPDAIKYAESDIKRQGKPATPTHPEDWLPRPLPSSEDQALMKQYGIVFEAWRYRYQDYRYDRLADAVKYAQKLSA